MKKIHKFFSKDLLHILGAVGIFVAFLISIAYKQVGIGALIAAWLIAMAIIGVAWITDIRKADLLKNGKIVSGKVTAVKRVHIKLNCTPFVRQYGILFRKWGVFVCQRDNESTTERRR